MKKLGMGGSLVLMLILRALYSMNWYNVSPLLFRITDFYGVSGSLTGLILSSFLIGTAIFQVPSGIVAARIGSRNTALTGMVIMSVSVILSIFSPDFLVFLISRFFVGLGSAFFFSSGIGVLNDLDRTNYSRNIAAFNTAFSVGGGVGVISYSVGVIYVNWQLLLLWGGIVTLVFTILAFIFIPSSPLADYRSDLIKNVKGRLTSKPLIFLSLSLAGYWGLNYTFEEYEKPFAGILNFSSSTAGLIGSLTLFAGILGLIIFKKISLRKPSLILPVLLLVVSMSIAFQASGIALYLFYTSIMGGTLSVILFSLEYSYVVKLEMEQRFVPLGISIMNAIQIAVGSVITFIFGYIFASNHYISWIILGGISLIFYVFGIKTIRNLS
ncbi:MFS transporter [Cuniculiplasma sp. SKW4]|uniref:MFS transporter n=1 Tax=Cuniculiplasma sp. SKW4 TaxID=3400171 RepID=UPI003FD240ED